MDGSAASPTAAQTGSARRADVTFDSHGAALSAWHYPPESDALTGANGAPVVVMAHGLSMTRDGGLQPYAEAFAAAGCHVVVFDYRGFGPSGGGPREVVLVDRQTEDYLAAIAFARSLPGVDPARVALWGTSYSGGIAIEAAYRDGNIAAIVSQVPNLDNLATLGFLVRSLPLRQLVWVCFAILADFLRGLLGLSPFYVKSIARRGRRGAYVSDESYAQVQRIAGPTFLNRFGMRDFLRPLPWRPVTRIPRLRCRILFVAALRDDLTPSEPVLRAAARAGDRAELLTYEVGHFGVYLDDALADALPKQAAFLARELAPTGAPADAPT